MLYTNEMTTEKLRVAKIETSSEAGELKSQLQVTKFSSRVKLKTCDLVDFQVILFPFKS